MKSFFSKYSLQPVQHPQVGAAYTSTLPFSPVEAEQAAAKITRIKPAKIVFLIMITPQREGRWHSKRYNRPLDLRHLCNRGQPVFWRLYHPLNLNGNR